jgi:hypothetical protein
MAFWVVRLQGWTGKLLLQILKRPISTLIVLWVSYLTCLTTMSDFLGNWKKTLKSQSSQHPSKVVSLWVVVTLTLQHLQLRCSLCDLHKYFSHPSLVIYFFANHLTHKTGTANKWHTTNSKPPTSIITIGQSETMNSSQIKFITLFYAGAQRCCSTVY